MTLVKICLLTVFVLHVYTLTLSVLCRHGRVTVKVRTPVSSPSALCAISCLYQFFLDAITYLLCDVLCTRRLWFRFMMRRRSLMTWHGNQQSRSTWFTLIDLIHFRAQFWSISSPGLFLTMGWEAGCCLWWCYV